MRRYLSLYESTSVRTQQSDCHTRHVLNDSCTIIFEFLFLSWCNRLSSAGDSPGPKRDHTRLSSDICPRESRLPLSDPRTPGWSGRKCRRTGRRHLVPWPGTWTRLVPDWTRTPSTMDKGMGLDRYHHNGHLGRTSSGLRGRRTSPHSSGDTGVGPREPRPRPPRVTWLREPWERSGEGVTVTRWPGNSPDQETTTADHRREGEVKGFPSSRTGRTDWRGSGTGLFVSCGQFRLRVYFQIIYIRGHEINFIDPVWIRFLWRVTRLWVSLIGYNKNFRWGQGGTTSTWGNDRRYDSRV